MGWTKREFLYAGFEEIGLAGYVFDLSPDQIQSALVRLDAMVGRLKGVCTHWPFSTSPTDANLDQDTRCPDYAVEAIILNSAIAIAPSYGKVLSADTKKNAKDAYDIAITWTSNLPPQLQMSAMLGGAGSKNSNMFIPPRNPPLTVKGNELIF